MAMFGVAVLTSGCWRYFSAEGGHLGLYFGLVMSLVAFFACFLFANDKTVPAYVASIVALGFVGGWFVYESFFVKGLEDAETRQLIIIGITFATAAYLIRQSLQKSESAKKNGSAVTDTKDRESRS